MDTKAKIRELIPDAPENFGLAVVLRAIEKVTKGTSYFVDPQGSFHEWFAPQGRLDLRTVGQWNLTKDNYDEQPEETKRFIGQLLNV